MQSGVNLRFPVRINTILSRVLKNMKMEEGMKNWCIVEKWPEIVGTKIAHHAHATAVDAQNLYVEVDNPAWQNQLFLMKSMLLEKCKKYHVSIQDIKFSLTSHDEKEKA